MSYLVSFCSCFFSPFSIAITSLGEERAYLSAFRTFVRFVLVWICRFPLPLGVWEGLRFVIVALPGLFSDLFFVCPNYLRFESRSCVLALCNPKFFFRYIGKACFNPHPGGLLYWPF